MDAGLAAVLGAVAGSLGSVVAAVAQREAVRISARAEHRKERRQPRHDAYRAFIQTAISLRERVIAYERYEDTTDSEELELFRGVDEKWIELSLLGPESVIDGASKTRDDALHLVAIMRVTRQLQEDALRSGLSEEEVAASESRNNSLAYLRHVAKELSDSADRFALIASAALDDDGTRRRFPSGSKIVGQPVGKLSAARARIRPGGRG